jgi:hypothetical protein
MSSVPEISKVKIDLARLLRACPKCPNCNATNNLTSHNITACPKCNSQKFQTRPDAVPGSFLCQCSECGYTFCSVKTQVENKIDIDWPAQGLFWCRICRRKFTIEDMLKISEKEQHPLPKKLIYIMTSKEARNKRSLGSYGEYRGRFIKSITGKFLRQISNEEKALQTLLPPRNSEVFRDTEIITPTYREARNKLKILARREKYGIKQVKSERSTVDFEKWGEPQIERVFFDMPHVNPAITERTKNLARKAWVNLDKRGRPWTYILLGIIQIVFDEHDVAFDAQNIWPKIELGTRRFKNESYLKILKWLIEKIAIPKGKTDEAILTRLKIKMNV